MSDALAGAKQNWRPDDQFDDWFEVLSGKYPTLASALIGEDGWEGSRDKRPPLSLILTNREGKLKFTLSNPEWPRTYHCQITSASDVLGSVESALAANQGEWVQKRLDRGSNGRR
jgi:hypothetical protein